MSREITPVGMACNIRCTYCYQNPVRDNGNATPMYDLNAILKTLGSMDKAMFTLFGGEPLLTRFDHLMRLLEFGFAKNGNNSIQTNGILITPTHVELFKRTNTSVGVSLDGPGPLNDAREKTEEAQRGLDLCLEAKISCSLIITLSRFNALPPHLPKLVSWLEGLHYQGLSYVRLHLMEVDEIAASDIALTQAEQIHAVKYLRQSVKFLKFDLFEDLRRGLLSEGQTSCIWNGCDPYTTPAVEAIDADGSLSNCGRTYKTGVAYRKSNRSGNERLFALYNTPQEYGGCQDCRFFVICKGECPGQAIDGDWRNRTIHCETIKSILIDLEGEVLEDGDLPVTFSSDLKKKELALLGAGNNNREHTDTPHIDTPHTDITYLGVAPVVE